MDDSAQEYKDTFLFEKKWEFDESVTKVFSEMLSRSIPGYAIIREMVPTIAKAHFSSTRLHVLDLGASLGEASVPFILDGHFVHMNELSEPMRESLQDRFESSIEKGHVIISDENLSKTFPRTGLKDIVLCILTLMFIPVENRISVLRNIRNRMHDESLFFYVEKTQATDSLIVDAYYEMKRKNGYTQEQIDSKKESLENVLVPVTSNMEEELLRAAGFTRIEPFFQSLMFKGWVVRL